MSEPKGRGAAWTEERRRSDEGRKHLKGAPEASGRTLNAQLSLQDLDLPRRNGELAFDAPWQSTVFALAAAVIENAFGGDREPFRHQLVAAIAAEPGRPYWESWTAALESLVQTLPR